MSPRRLAPAIWAFAQSPNRPPDTITHFQEGCLQRLVKHAYTNVPFYHRRFDAAGIDPREIRTLQDLASIPSTTRSDLQNEKPSDLCASSEDLTALRVISTSGSTGAPVTIRRTFNEESLMLAFRVRALMESGFQPHWRNAALDYFSEETRRWEGRPTLHTRLGLIGRRMIDWRTPKNEIVETLSRYGPEKVSGPPSTLCWIADEWTAADRRRVPLRMISVGAETTTPSMRKRIEQGFGAPSVDVYGCHETVFIGMRGLHKHSHRICRDAAIVEVLRDGKPVQPGETGELVVTALHLYAMPFIRYHLGDVVTVDEVTGNGETVQSLRSIDGRVTEYFQLPDGTRLHPCVFSDGVKESGLPVRRFQVVQQKRDDFLVRLVLLNGARPDLDLLTKKVSQALGPGIAVQTELVDALNPKPGAKFRPYIPLERLDSWGR